MDCLHVTTDIEAGPARGVAEEVDDMLTDAFLRISAGALEKPPNLGIGGQAADEVIGNRGERVVSAEPLVKRWLLCECGADERQRDKGDAKEPCCVSMESPVRGKLCLEGSTIIRRGNGFATPEIEGFGNPSRTLRLTASAKFAKDWMGKNLRAPRFPGTCRLSRLSADDSDALIEHIDGDVGFLLCDHQRRSNAYRAGPAA